MPNPHTFTGDPEIPILSKTAAFLIILYQSFNTFLTHRIDNFRIFAS